MDLVRIKDRLLAAKRTSESKHYKVSIAELIGVLIDLVDEIETLTVFKDAARTTKHPTVFDKPPTLSQSFDGVESPPPLKWAKEKGLDSEK